MLQPMNFSTRLIFFTISELPEKIVANEVLGDFNNVVDIESGNARYATFRTIVLGHPQYSDHIVTRSVNISVRKFSHVQ